MCLSDDWSIKDAFFDIADGTVCMIDDVEHLRMKLKEDVLYLDIPLKQLKLLNLMIDTRFGVEK